MAGDKRDVVIQMDGRDGGDGRSNTAGKIWRESSYDFFGDIEKNKVKEVNNGNTSYRFDFDVRDGGGSGGAPPLVEEDPPSKLIGQFLHKQKASGDFSLDMDLEMEELKEEGGATLQRSLTPVTESPTTATVVNRVSFDPNAPGSEESVRRRKLLAKESPSTDSGGGGGGGRGGGGSDGDEEILKVSSRSNAASFSSNASFKRKSSLFKEKTKSRLMDPPPQPPKSGRIATGKSGQVGKSKQMKSGFLGRSSAIDEDDDESLLDEDLPEELKKDKLDVWILLEWVSLILIIGALACTFAIPYLRRKNVWKLRLWKWEVLVLVLICGRLVSGWVIRVIVFFIERNFLLRKRVLYFVYGIKKAVQNCLWLGWVLLAWHFLFDKKIEKETSLTLRYVTKILVCLVVGTLLWLVKTLVVKVLASSFHVSTYFDRIQESLFNQYVIETLSGPPLVELKRNADEEAELAAEVQKLQNAGVTVPAALQGNTSASVPAATQANTTSSPQSARVIGSGRLQRSPRVGTPKLSRVQSGKNGEGDEGITIDHLHKLNPKNVSAWNMKRLINIVRHGTLSTLDEQLHETDQNEDESATKIRSEVEAKIAARKIFLNVAKPGARYIYLEDIMRFMPEDEALKAMNLFEAASESKKISKKCLKNWVVNAFRERRAIALTLNDTKTAVNNLHRMINVLVGILIVIIWLLILGIATTKFLVVASSQIVVLAFVFGNTCKTVFESIIFLFVIHPFDVGDRVEIDGVQMVVEEMKILTTIFLRFDNQKIIITNSVLATKTIGNYYRSPDMGDVVEFLVHIATPAEKIATLKQRITSYIENKKEHWYAAPMIVFKDVEDLNKVRIAIWLTHTMNHQDMGEKFTRRSLLIEEMMKIFRELDIQYRLFPVDINVRTLPPITSDRVPPGWAS